MLYTLMRDILTELGVPYSTDRDPPDNIKIRCMSDTCRTVNDGKLKLEILMRNIDKKKAGQYHCWRCGTKGTNILSSLDKVLRDYTPEGVTLKEVYKQKIDDYKKGTVILPDQFKKFIHDVFEINPNIEQCLLEGLVDNPQMYNDLLKVYARNDRLYIRKDIDQLSSHLIPLDNQSNKFRLDADRSVYTETVKMFLPEHIEYTSSPQDALYKNLEHIGENYTAVYIDENSNEADEIEDIRLNGAMGKVHTQATIPNNQIKHDAVRYLNRIYPSGNFTTSDVTSKLLSMLSKGHLATLDMEELEDFYFNMEADVLPIRPMKVLIVGMKSDIEGVLKNKEVNRLLGLLDVTHFNCKGGYEVNIKTAEGALKRLLNIFPEEIQDLKSTIKTSTPELILTIGSGFYLLNAVVDEAMMLDLTSPLRKSLYELSGVTHHVNVENSHYRVLIFATETVRSLAFNQFGRENKVISATNSVYTELFKSRVWTSLIFYLKFLPKFYHILDDTLFMSEKVLHKIQCHYTLREDNFNTIIDFCRGKVLGMDIEATGLFPYNKESRFQLLSIAVCDGDFTHSIWLEGQPRVEELIREMFKVCKISVFHNASFDLGILMYLFESVKDYINHNPDKFEDTMGLAKVFRIHADHTKMAEVGPISLNSLTKTLFGFFVKQSIVEVDRTSMWRFIYGGMEQKRVALLYNGGDSRWTKEIYDSIYSIAGRDGNKSDQHTWYKNRMEVTIACCNIVNNGMPFSLDSIINTGNALKTEADSIRDKINNHPLVKDFLGSIHNSKNMVEVNPKSSDFQKDFATGYLGLPKPDVKYVKTHGNSKAGAWKFMCESGEVTSPKGAVDIFSWIVDYGSTVSLINSNIKPFRNVILYKSKDDPSILSRITFLDDEKIDFDKIEEFMNQENLDSGNTEDDFTEEDFEDLEEGFKFSTDGKANFFPRVSEDANGTLRFHTNFYVFGATVTGRISSRPNLQNITGDMRHLYKAPEGSVFCGADCGAADVSGAAVTYNDENLLTNLWLDKDTHKEMAKRLIATTEGCVDDILVKYHKLYPEESEDKILKAIRTVTKSKIVFATIYGSHPDQIKATMELTDGTFSRFYENDILDYLGGVKAGQEEMIKSISKKGYYLRRGFNIRIYGDLQRTQWFNYPVQGFTAEWANSSLLPLIRSGVRVCNIVHDEVISESLDQNKDRDLSLICKHLCTEVLYKYPELQKSVPLSVEGGYAQSWGDLKSSLIMKDTSKNYGFTERRAVK